MSVLGFDPSLSCSGFAYLNEGEVWTGRIQTKKLKDAERLRYVREAFCDVLDAAVPTLLAYEGYSMGSKGKTFHIGELGGVLRVAAWERGVDMVIVPPMTLKMWTTGKGNADKPKMIAAVKERFGYDILSDDECDAYLLMKFGEAYLRGALGSHAEKCAFVSGEC